MKQVGLIQEISDLLIQFSKEVKDKGKLKLTDINILSEDVLVPIFSIVYDTNFKNLNNEKANYPGIDLASDEHIIYGGSAKNIAIQVTSSNDINKIKKTLKQYIEKEFYKKFDDIYIFILTEKQENYQKKSIEEINKIVDNKFVFNLNANVIDRINLSTKITSLTPISKIETIHKLLQDQFVYRKKSLLSLELWESEGKVGYGFSNLINGLDITTYNTLIKNKVTDDVNDLILLLLKKYNSDFKNNYDKSEKDKNKNLAYKTYLKAGFEQALNSYTTIKERVESKIDIEYFKTSISKEFKELITNIDESDFPLLNQPIHHPAISFIKETVRHLFTTCGIDSELHDAFIKDFNQNISNCIVDTFGLEKYQAHIEQTKDKWIKMNEFDLLSEMRNLSKLGFSEDEDFQYQEAFGSWKDIRKFGIFDIEDNDEYYKNIPENTNEKELIKKEQNLYKVEELIDEYFFLYKDDKEGYLHNILFLIADFGKGKTSFLKHFASKLAKDYLRKHEGLFPVYLNLNEYDKYSNSPSLGVISYYLETKFKIDIRDEYYKKKDYFFLIDSLDECGELTEVNIENVIKDIIDIQGLDRINQRKNRIVIASRPISIGLKEQIKKYKPFEIVVKDKETNKKETTQNFISIYGFKKEQFNNYVEFALKNDINKGLIDDKSLKGFPQKVIKRIFSSNKIDIFSQLFNKVLKGSELKRPIFAYMIYKLIVSNSNFIDLGKVGVYVSFLNQLSRDAKHKDDCNYEVTLKDEFIYRNILNASAILWQYKRQSGKQTTLTKADICRTIEGEEIDKDDRAVLNRFSDIESINFLSHSYLGEKENTLHFQHQSFAEILLAEYYLKVFLKFAFDDNVNVEDARAMLTIGIPTDQTIEFLKGMIIMLKEASIGNCSDKDILEKRKLFMPLLASLSITNHNKKLYSTWLDYKWFDNYKSDFIDNNIIPSKAIEDFPVDFNTLNKIENLCLKILESSKVYFLGEASSKSLLFKDELIVSSLNRENLIDIDKWFSLMVGNLIKTNVEERIFFNAKLEGRILFDMIKNISCLNFNPLWANSYFTGISMQNNNEVLAYEKLNCPGFDFSHSYLKNIIIRDSNLSFANFNNCVFDFFNLISTEIRQTFFEVIEIKSRKNEQSRQIKNIIDDELFEGDFCLTFCEFDQGLLFPKDLNNILKGVPYGLVNYSGGHIVMDEDVRSEWFSSSIFRFRGIFKYIIEKKGVDIITNSIRFGERAKSNFQDSRSNRTIEEVFKEFLFDIENEVKTHNNKNNRMDRSNIVF